MAVAGGYTDSLVNLGVLLRQRGDLGGAEECYRAAIAAGDTGAMNNLGNLLRQRGDLTGAEECYRVAAAAGNPDALASYGAVHAQRDDWDRAEEFFRRSAEAGNVAGMLNYAQALARKGRGGEAQRWLLAARDTQAPVPPQVPVPGGQGQVTDVDAVTQWLSGPAAAGNLDAQAALGLLRQQPPPAGPA
jgi:TPR repeat protein